MRTKMETAQRAAVALRRATGEDEPFLHALYADRRAPELERLGWGAADAQAFLDMQFRAQQAGYTSTFPAADHWIVTVGTTAAGRLLVDRRPDEHRVVDLVLLTPYRGRGVGTSLMNEVMADAAGAGRPVRLSVAAHEHRLVRWYERLGFVVVKAGFPDIGMAWKPDDRTGS